jgi:hypothetical protein
MKTKFTMTSWVLIAVCLLLMIPATLQAQDLRGKITGRVMDPNGAAVPGANVKVTDVARNKTVDLITNSEGLFEAPYLVPGTYQVLVEMAGFKKSLEQTVQVAINETRTLQIKMDIGTPSETVTVTAEPAQLNAADGNLGLTIDRKRVDELPSIHGDPYTLMGLAPGVAYIGSARLDRPFEPTHIAGFAMNGARGIRSDLLIDGAPSTATANANEVIASYVPPTDITQEFKVQTTTYDSQFGNTEGGVTSIAIKSGTNQLHGTAYYWIEPGGWAANDFFGNSRGQARPFTFSNRPGFSISGPITIPHVYNGKDKTFFLFSYEGIRDSRPRFDATNVWVPTSALASGDFSAYISKVKIFDPLTGTFNATTGAVTNRTAFTNNIIPANRISPVAKAVLPFLGSPKGGAANGFLINGNIFDSTLAEKTRKYDNFTVKIDHNFTKNDHFFGRYSWYNRDSSYNNYTGTDYIGDRFAFISKQTALDEVHTFNAKTVLNVRYGYNRFIRATDGPEGQAGFDLTTLGFAGSFNSLIPTAIRRFPRFDFSCSSSCTGAPLGNGHTNENRPVDSHFVTAVLNRVEGKHSLKLGGEMRIYREDDNFRSNNQSGQFAFDNTYTRVGSASAADVEGLGAFASFLLGYPTTMSLTRAADYSEYSKTYGFFVNDDIRVSRKLTVGLGLRWEFETPLIERQNKSVSGFDLSYTQPLEATARANYATLSDTILKTTLGLTDISAKGGLLFAAKDTGRGLYNTPKNGFLPRGSFAYQWNSKTVFRGGFGLYQGFLGERRGDVIQSGYSQTTTVPLTTGPNGAPLPVTLSSAFLTTTIIEPTGNSLGRQTALGQSISFFNQNPKVSKQARFSFGVQRQLWGGWVLDASYVGDRGYDIEITQNINALPNKYLNADNSRTAAMQANNSNLGGSVRNPFCTNPNGSVCVGGALFPNAGGTTTRRQLLLPFPEFGTINTTNNDGKSWYNSAQFTLSKRFWKGYDLQFAYTRSKWIEAVEYLNPADPKPSRAIAAQDAPNRFSMSGFYEFPFGKGKQFLTHAGRFADAIVGGWQIEGTYTFQSGFPLRFANDAFYLGTQISIPKNQETLSRWFNTGAFVSVLGATLPTCEAFPTGSTNCATPADHLRTLPFYYADVRMQTMNNVDLGLRKDIHINERMKVQLRMEFVNAFNHPLLSTLSGGGAVVSPSSSAFGTVSASNQQNYARRAQLMAKFIF